MTRWVDIMFTLAELELAIVALDALISSLGPWGGDTVPIEHLRNKLIAAREEAKK